MPIYFEQSSHGKGPPQLVISGTKSDLARFGEALRREAEASSVFRDTNRSIDIPHPRLLSDDFGEIVIRAIDEESFQKLRRAGERKSRVALVIWLVIVGAIILLYVLGGRG